MIDVQPSIDTRCTITYNPQERFTDAASPHDHYIADFTIVYVPRNVVLHPPSFERWLHDTSLDNQYTPPQLTEVVYKHLIINLEPQELSVTTTIATPAHAPLRITIP